MEKSPATVIESESERVFGVSAVLADEADADDAPNAGAAIGAAAESLPRRVACAPLAWIGASATSTGCAKMSS